MVALAASAVGCSSSDDTAERDSIDSEVSTTTDEPSVGLPSDVSYFPTFSSPAIDSAALGGVLELKDGCLVVSDGDASYLIHWPDGSSVVIDDGQLVVRIRDLFDDTLGRDVVVGELLRAGGNQGQAEGEADSFGNTQPSGCPQDAWWIDG